MTHKSLIKHHVVLVSRQSLWILGILRIQRVFSHLFVQLFKTVYNFLLESWIISTYKNRILFNSRLLSWFLTFTKNILNLFSIQFLLPLNIYMNLQRNNMNKFAFEFSNTLIINISCCFMFWKNVYTVKFKSNLILPTILTPHRDWLRSLN